MRRPAAILTVLLLSLTLAACSSGGGATAAPASAAPPAASEPAASIGGGGGGGGCTASTDAPTVEVSIASFAFSPADVQAKVGDVIGFTNDDSASHTATLDEGDCTTESLTKGQTGALAFGEAGTFPFHCAIHSAMTGTITVTE